jgi:hypothetical protein
MKSKVAMAAFMAVLAVGAGSASASAAGINFSQGLQITENGTPLKNGAPTYNDEVILNHCVVEANGRLVNNSSAIDLLTSSAPTYTACEEGAVSGGLGVAAFADDGTAWMYPNITLTLPGSCSYDFGVLQGSFPVGDGGVLYVTGQATGYRSLRSSHSCASTISTPFALAEVGPNSDSPLGTELTSSPRC